MAAKKRAKRSEHGVRVDEDDMLIYILGGVVMAVARRDLGGADASEEEIAALVDKILIKMCMDKGLDARSAGELAQFFDRRINEAMDRLGIPFEDDDG